MSEKNLFNAENQQTPILPKGKKNEPVFVNTGINLTNVSDNKEAVDVFNSSEKPFEDDSRRTELYGNLVLTTSSIVKDPDREE
jgi:hypothetical protein